MKNINKVIGAVLSTVMLAGSTAFAEVHTDMKYIDAVSGAVVIDIDMICQTQSNVTKQQLMDTVFDYKNGSDSSVSSVKNAYDAEFTLCFGEDKPKKITMFRAYVYGSDSEDTEVPITVYGSNDGVSWTELATIASPVQSAWNEEYVKSDSVYSYIKVTSEKTETGEDEIADDGTIIAGETNTYHQKITSIAFFEETAEDVTDKGNTSASGTTEKNDDIQFSDVEGHWAADVIEAYAKNGHINGYEDGTFRPDNGVSVSEFCRIVSSIKGINYKISAGNWALPYIREMMDAGVIERNDFNDFSAKMTREQVAKAANSLMSGEYYPKDLSQYEQYITDASDIDDRYKEYVLKTYVSGVLNGYEDGSWRPQGEVTRAEILSILDRVFNKDMRVLPEVMNGVAAETPEKSYYYSAAVQVRKNTSAASMQYRLYGSDAQYMEENDDSTGLKLENEIQGAQGFAMVLRYDISEIKEKRDKLEKLYINAEWKSGGTAGNELGLWFYSYDADQTDWNNSLYCKNLNGSAVAGDDISGYNSVTSNITAILPTWGNSTMAVPNDEKTKPIAKSPRTDKNNYIFDVTDYIDEIIANANDNNMAEFIVTTVNYDDYGQSDDKPHIYTAGENAPKLNAEYATQDDGIDYSGLTINLTPEDAVLNGGALELEETDGIQNIAYFVQDQEIVFNVDALTEGDYLMRVNTSASTSAGGTVRFTLNGESFDTEFPYGEGWTVYKYSDVKTVHLKKGENILSITGVKWNATYLINIRNVVFELQQQ